MLGEDPSILTSQLAELELYELTNGPHENKAGGQSPGAPSAEEYYIQFLSLYLLKMDLMNAKFLWKRIPASVKESNKNLDALWNLGQMLFRRDVPSFLRVATELIKDTSYPDALVYLVKQMIDTQRQLTLRLMETAYSSISLDCASNLLCLSTTETSQLMLSRDWKLCPEGKYLLASETMASSRLTGTSENVAATQAATNEELMSKLAEFMCFIENH